MGYKTLICINKIETLVLKTAFFLVMLIGIYAIYDSLYVYNNAYDQTLLNYRPKVTEDGTVITHKRISDDMVGWINMTDTTIDFPIMQGEDNYEYINKDPYGEYSFSGSIFVDSRNKRDFSEPYVLIYGHHMDQGAMFGALDKYENESYFNEHKYGTLIVSETAYKVRAFAFIKCLASDNEIFDPIADIDRMTFINERSSILQEYEGGKIISLTTCDDSGNTARTIVLLEVIS